MLAITICEDAWNDKDFWHDRLYASDPVEKLMQQTLDGRKPSVLINVSASPYWEGKQQVRRSMVGALAQRYRVPAMMVAQVGGNDSLIFDGASFIVDAEGQVLAAAASFEEDFLLFDTAIPARLKDTGGLKRGDRITHAFAIGSLDDIDDELRRWLRKAYEMDA